MGKFFRALKVVCRYLRKESHTNCIRDESDGCHKDVKNRDYRKDHLYDIEMRCSWIFPYLVFFLVFGSVRDHSCLELKFCISSVLFDFRNHRSNQIKFFVLVFVFFNCHLFPLHIVMGRDETWRIHYMMWLGEMTFEECITLCNEKSWHTKDDCNQPLHTSLCIYFIPFDKIFRWSIKVKIAVHALNMDGIYRRQKFVGWLVTHENWMRTANVKMNQCYKCRYH